MTADEARELGRTARDRLRHSRHYAHCDVEAMRREDIAAVFLPGENHSLPMQVSSPPGPLHAAFYEGMAERARIEAALDSVP